MKFLSLYVFAFIVLWVKNTFFHSSANAAFQSAPENFLYFSGALAMALACLVLMLAVRPRWADRLVGGPAQVLKVQKLAAIGTALIAALHGAAVVLGALSGEPATLIPVLPELFSDEAEAWLLGKWAAYAALILLAVAVWHTTTRKAWQNLHAFLPALFLLLLLHSLARMPLAYLDDVIGWVLLVVMAQGLYAAVAMLVRR